MVSLNIKASCTIMLLSLKNKLMLVISIITTLFTLVSVCIIAYLSIASMKTAAINKAEQDLVSKRVLITKELNNYIGTIEKQAVVMAKDVSI